MASIWGGSDEYFGKVDNLASHVGRVILAMETMGIDEDRIKADLQSIIEAVAKSSPKSAKQKAKEYGCDSLLPVIIEDLVIPIEFNDMKIVDVLNSVHVQGGKGVSSRLVNILLRADLIYIRDLFNISASDLARLRHFGPSTQFAFIKGLKDAIAAANVQKKSRIDLDNYENS